MMTIREAIDAFFAATHHDAAAAGRHHWREGIIVKKFALCFALAAGLAGTAQAALVEFERTAINAAPIAGFTSRADLMVAGGAVFAQPDDASELPEPEVFAMMLVGLVLIGWRASKHSEEKFE